MVDDPVVEAVVGATTTDVALQIEEAGESILTEGK